MGDAIRNLQSTSKSTPYHNFCMFQPVVLPVNHNFEGRRRAWGQRAGEALPPTQQKPGRTHGGGEGEEEVRAEREREKTLGAVENSLKGVGEEGGGEEGEGTYPSLPSIAAAPPGMILVMKIPGSSGMWGLSIPPAMLKPRPELPCTPGCDWHVQESAINRKPDGSGGGADVDSRSEPDAS